MNERDRSPVFMRGPNTPHRIKSLADHVREQIIHLEPGDRLVIERHAQDDHPDGRLFTVITERSE